MFGIFYDSSKDDFQVNKSLPKNYEGYVLKGSDATTIIGDNAVVINQQLCMPLFTVKFTILELLKPVELAIELANSKLASILSLRNNIVLSVIKKNEVKLNEHQFLLYKGSNGNAHSKLIVGQKFESFEVEWSDEIVNQIVPFFPFFESLLFEKSQSKKIHFLDPRNASFSIINLALDILRAPYDENLSKLYFEYKVREYLFLLLSNLEVSQIKKTFVTKEQKEIIEKIAEELRSNPNKKYPITRLSQKAQMNEVKLEVAFKERFGSGIFEYQMAARMREAHRLLEETDLSTKAIASIVGYRLTTSFITKFREYFGYPPGSVTKNKRRD